MRACRKARQQTDEDESIVMRLDQHLHHYLTIFILKCGVSAVMPPHETWSQANIVFKRNWGVTD